MKKNIYFILVLCLAYCMTAQVTTTGLLGYWPFDGNANDFSGNNNNGIVSSASLTTDRFGNIDKAYYFNGINGLITVPNSPTVDIPNNTSFSLSFWLKTDANVGYANLLAKHDPGFWNGYSACVNNFDQGYCTSAGHLLTYVASGAQQDACTNTAIANDIENWYHVTSVYNSYTNQIKLYINATLQSDIGQKSGITSNSENLLFGGLPIPSSSPFNNYNSYYKGKLDDIRIYNRILSLTEVNDLYNEVNPAALSLSNTINKASVMSVFPNPVNTTLHLQYDENKFNTAAVQYTIASVTGNVLKTAPLVKQDKAYEIDVAELSKGFYVLTIQSAKKTETVRFIKD